MMADLSALGALELAQAYRARDLSPVEVTVALLEAIEARNGALGAFCHVDVAGATRAAYASETRWRAGRPLSALDGVPVCFKDNVAVAGMPTLWGAAGVSDAPSAFDSCAVARVREAGLPILGKTAMAEMGFYASGANSRYPPPRNPHDPTRTAGGSSGGSAAAVSGGLSPLAVGSDGAGSVRMPASFCGIVGVKPSGGRVATFPPGGANPVLGPMARNVADAAALLHVLARPDDRDPNALPFAPPDYVAGLDEGMAGLTLGYLPRSGYGETVAPAVARAVEQAVAALEGQGARVIEMDPIFAFDLFEAAAASGLPPLAQLIAGLTGGQTGGLLEPTRAALAWARTVDLPAFLASSQKVGGAVREFHAAVRPFDAVLTPTLTRTAFGALEPYPADAEPGLFGYAFGFAAFVHIANLAAVPAASVPCGRDGAGLPIGLQVIGKKFDEAMVLRIAAAVERACGPLPVSLPAAAA